MTLPLGCRSLYLDVMERAADRLRRMSVKAVQHLLNVSKPSAQNARFGEIPRTENFVALLAKLGPQGARAVLAPVIGEMPEAEEFETLREIRRSLARIEQARVRRGNATTLDQMGVVPMAAVAAEGGLCGDEGGSDRQAERLAVERQPVALLDDRGAGEEGSGHLVHHLHRWRDSIGRAERSSLIGAARQTPHLRTSIVTPRGADLIYDEITPAFRLHGAERDRLIGKPTTDTFDKDYAEACAANTRSVIALGEPALDEVGARIRVEPGVWLDINYRRLVLPYSDGRMKFAVCASEALAA